MVTCALCSTPNDLDSVFCRKCGAAIPDDARRDAQMRLDALVLEGVEFYNAGRTEEALSVAETALEANPRMISALALASDCHARYQDYARALDFADRIVDLASDSELDKIKRNQLRNQLQRSLEVPPGPDRRIALVAAVAAVVLFGSIGALVVKIQGDRNQAIALAAQQAESDRQSSLNKQVTVANLGNPGDGTGAGGLNPGLGTGQNLGPNPANPVQMNPGEGQPVVSRPHLDQGTGLPPYEGSRLPDPLANGGTTVVPINPTGPTGDDVGTTPGKIDRSEPDPKPIKPNSPGGSEPDDEQPDPGEYSFTIRKNNTPDPQRGGAAPVNSGLSGNAEQALSRTARQQFESGDLSAAAGSYEKALAAGGDPVSINQRLGMIYSRLNRNAEAARAYERAISSAESAVASGKGGERVKATIESCKQALRVLRGN